MTQNEMKYNMHCALDICHIYIWLLLFVDCVYNLVLLTRAPSSSLPRRLKYVHATPKLTDYIFNIIYYVNIILICVQILKYTREHKNAAHQREFVRHEIAFGYKIEKIKTSSIHIIIVVMRVEWVQKSLYRYRPHIYNTLCFLVVLSRKRN